jgi:hypothetical protein
LEKPLDLSRPRWRELLVKKQPLLNMVVCNAIVTPANGRLGGRPDIKIEDNLYII